MLNTNRLLVSTGAWEYDFSTHKLLVPLYIVFQKFRSLTSLVLTENRFDEKGTVSLIQSLQHNSTLTVLNIGPEKISSSQLKGSHCSVGDKSTTMDIVLAKNRELRYCKKLIRELQQKNETLIRERDALREELHVKKVNTL